ncbi:hypothetical protein WKI68_28735 [Streptomyces sp. MS1.HAVA.3]|uniref:Uncharacterized protein n=1 Tax=Streptomyces caledonius TaxID=3134107 RepID=A0ABU8U8N6_9ACTN
MSASASTASTSLTGLELKPNIEVPSAPEAFSRAVLTSSSNSVTALTVSAIRLVQDRSISGRSGSWRIAFTEAGSALLKS